MTYRYNEHGDIYGYESSDGVKKLVTGLLLGALVGGVVMLFLAPASGKKTMAKLRKKTKKLYDEAYETVDDTMQVARHRLDKATAGVRKQAKELKGRGADLYDEQREHLAEVVERGRKRVTSR
jgi:gas vesicle protein